MGVVDNRHRIAVHPHLPAWRDGFDVEIGTRELIHLHLLAQVIILSGFLQATMYGGQAGSCPSGIVVVGFCPSLYGKYRLKVLVQEKSADAIVVSVRDEGLNNL